MNNLEEIVYFLLNFIIKTKEFRENIKIGIKTKGYQIEANTDNLSMHSISRKIKQYESNDTNYIRRSP